MTDFNFVGKSYGENELLVSDAEFKVSKKGKLTDLSPSNERYNRVVSLLAQGKSVIAGLRATNDPAFTHTHNTLSMFLTNLEEALK